MAHVRQVTLLLCAAAWILVVCAAGGCGSNNLTGGPDAGVGDATGMFGMPEANAIFGGDDGGIPAPCPGGGIACYVPPGCTTSVSGTVFDPAGRNPLYNVVVFVPNDPYGTLQPITPGTHSCNTCDVSIGDYVAATLTDAKGNFTLTGVPATSHVPLVVQTGKWRREVFLPRVAACDNTPVDATNSRLPKNHMEGDLPQMALLTGGCDDLGCFMKSMGIDDAEYTAPHGGGRLDVYQGVGIAGAPTGARLSTGGAGNCTGPGCPLWASRQSFEYYDIAILSCECAENRQTKPAAGVQALHDWLDEGGKVFASHYQYSWFKYGAPDFQNVATWLGASTANGAGNFAINTSFPKGMTYHDWLDNVGALGRNGTITLNSVATSVSTVNPPTIDWIYEPSNSYTKYLSFLTPIGGIAPAPGADGGAPVADAGGVADAGSAADTGATPDASVAETGTDAAEDANGDADEADAEDEGGPMEAGRAESNGPTYCGKAVFTDLHTSSSLTSQVDSIPNGCSGAPMTAQQKALEYLFFDLSACVSVDSVPPPPPPPPTK
jgi:hypothetical protein